MDADTTGSSPPIGRSTALATAGTALSRITGFVRLAATAYALGVAETRLTDTYNLANTTPNIVYELVLGGFLSGVFLYLFVEVRDTQGNDEAWLFIKRFMNLAMVVLGAIAVVGVLAAPWIIKGYTFRAPLSQRHAQQVVGGFLLALFAPQVVFYGLNTISGAALRANRKFGVFMFAPVFNNLIVAATFAVFAVLVPRHDRTLHAIPMRGILVLGIGTTLGVVAQGLIPWFYLRRFMPKIKRAGFSDPRFKRLLRMSAYTLGYVLLNQLGLWVTTVLADQVRGGISARDTAFVFFQLPHGLLAVSISTVLATSLAERAVAGDLEGFGSSLVRGLRATSFLLLPAVAGYIAIGPQIVRFLLQHGVASSHSTSLVSNVLRGYAVGLVFFSSWNLVLVGFQQLGDTRTPMFINLGAFMIQTVAGVTLFTVIANPEAKIVGLAVAHAGSYIFASVIGFMVLSRRVGGVAIKSLASTLIRASAGAILVGISAWGIVSATQGSLGSGGAAGELAQIALAVTASLLIYAAVSKLLRMEELHWLSGLVPRKMS